MESNTLADVLDRMVGITESMMDSGAPSSESAACPICDLAAVGASEHDPDCAYRIARTQISPADVAEVRRLARVLRYAG